MNFIQDSQQLIKAMSDKFVDYCPSIKPGDDKYRTVQNLLQQNGCLEANQLLTQCLNQHRKDFSKCTNQNKALAQCVRKGKKR